MKINQHVIIAEYSLLVQNLFHLYVALAVILDQNTMITTWFWLTMHTTDIASWYHDLMLFDMHPLDMEVNSLQEHLQMS